MSCGAEVTGSHGERGFRGTSPHPAPERHNCRERQHEADDDRGDYSNLPALLIAAIVVGFVLPLSAILVFGRRVR